MMNKITDTTNGAPKPPLRMMLPKGAPMKKKMTPEQLRDMFAAYYEGQTFIRVLPYGAENETGGFISANGMAGVDYANILVTGNEDRIMVMAMFDNLGKGASGAAIECMNISMGIEPSTGLEV